MRQWPRLAGALGVCALALIVMQRAIPVRAQTATQTFEGLLNIVWGDPHPTLGGSSAIYYTLTLNDGRTIPLQLPAGNATAFFGKRVVVSGQMVAGTAAPAGQQGDFVRVDRMALSQETDFETSAVLGTRKVIYLLAKFSDDADGPHPAVFYTDLNNPDTPPTGEVFHSTVNGFFKKTSWNQFSWTGDVAGVGGLGAPGGWLTLPQPKAFYAPCGWAAACAGAQLNTLAEDAMTLGRAQGIDFKGYDNINLVLSNDLDCCAYGGSHYSSVDAKSYGMTWEPPWGQELDTYAHEMGHSIGLPHSGWVYFSYDSPWDVMSAHAPDYSNSPDCGSYLSKNNNGAISNLICHEPGDGYIAGHKDYLGWIPPANEVVLSAHTSAVVALEADALALSSAAKLLKICLPGLPCTGSTAHYLTVEARVKGLGNPSQFDNGIPGDGVIIHDFLFGRTAISGPCYFNSQSGFAVPIDATPNDYDTLNCNSGGRVYPNYALYNAQWQPGQTYSGGLRGVRVSVVNRAGSTFTVSASTPPTDSDVDGDGKADPTIFRPSSGQWFTLTSSSGFLTNASYMWGLNSDVAVPGDYDGDGRIDIAVYRPSSGVWYVLKSSTNFTSSLVYQWGLPGDVPVRGDYDGDGIADFAVYRPSNGSWFVLKSSSGFTAWVMYTWGVSGDMPVPNDFDGDGRTDIAVYRPSSGLWYVLKSSSNFTTFIANQWGTSGDVPVPSDYDGDGKADIAVFRPSSGAWFVLKSSTNFTTFVTYQWGLASDVPVPGDFDGDGKSDIAQYRPSTGSWFVLKSSSNYTTYDAYQWGIPGDIPILGRP